MGSWDVSVFGNDEARKWLSELLSGSSTEPVFRALVSTAKVGPEQYLQAPESECALAAAELVAAARGLPGADLPVDAHNWLLDQQFVAGVQIAELAIRVIDRIATNSELKEVWDDTDSAPDWYTSIRALQARLQKSLEHGDIIQPRQKIVTVEDLCEEAKVLIAQTKYPDALAKYDQAISIDSESQMGYLGRGICHLWLRQYERVVEDINKALSVGKPVPDAYQLRAQAYFHLEKYKNVVVDLTAYLRSHPQHVESYLIRGLAYERLDQTQNALADFSKIIDRKSPDHLKEALTHRAGCYDRLGRPDLAAWDRQYVMQLDAAPIQH